MSIEDIKARAITVKVGENLRIHTPNGENTISFSPEQMPEKAFNYNGASICFVVSKTMYVLPYHSENYVEMLTDSGFERNTSLHVPLSDGLSYPTTEKEKWLSMMEKSRATA